MKIQSMIEECIRKHERPEYYSYRYWEIPITLLTVVVA